MIIWMSASSFLFSSTIHAQKVGQCDLGAKKGLIVYFDLTACHHTIQANVKPRAIRYVNQEPFLYAGLKDAPNTLCIPDDQFNAHFYLDDGKQGSAVANINVAKRTNNFQAFYQTHSDDQAYRPGKGARLPIIAPLANIRFADTPQNHAKINESSTSNDVLTTSTPANALYIYFCAEA